MRLIAEMILAAVDLIEGELKTLDRAVRHLAARMVLGMVCVGLLLAGLVMTVWGLYVAIAPATGAAGAAFIAGGASLAAAGLLAVIGGRMLR